MKKKEDFTILVTEQNNPNTTDIDTCSTLDLVRKINNEDKKVAEAVEKVLDSIALAIDKGASVWQGEDCSTGAEPAEG